ncbi:caspase-6 [Heteronotia binoei]|uniref:caspase-6 n=1 Tax=Heteronotia binoei TaxID=13085 RepID=UPI0029300FCF|nr:caspase-6 [Heteronotia binoei]
MRNQQGSLVTKSSDIIQVFQKFYQKLYESENPKPDKIKEYLTSINYNVKISSDHKAYLEQDITPLEVSETLKHIKNNKAPGRDGIPIEFYKAFEQELLEPLVHTCNSVMYSGEMPNTWSEARITVIPKPGKDKQNPASFRPISVLNNDFKIFSALMANRLNNVITEYIHDDQSGFIPTRTLTDNIQQIDVDSKPALQFKDGQQNFIETDALHTSSHLFDPAAEYKMNHKRRGLALIFNHEHFFWHLMLPDRRGTVADRENLKRSLIELGFEVKCFDDLKAEDVYQNIYNVSTDKHEDVDCFMCVFLSHGEDDHVYAYDAKIKIQTLASMFKGDKCPSLAGKPKIFIVQACRGDKHDDPVIVADTVDSTADKSDVNETEVDAAAVYTLPAGADFLMCYSVAEGYYSHRETLNGSWYIQDLCDMIRRHGSSLEFTELLTLVNRKVAHRNVDVCRDTNALGKKQIPCFASMLTKKLYFYPKSK